MNIKVNSKDLLECLGVVGSIVNPKVSELIKKQVKICATADSVTLYTFNDSTVLSGEISGEAEVEEEGEACIDIFYLSSLLGKLNGTVSIVRKDKIVNIKCGRSRYKTTVFPDEEFKDYTSVTKVKGEVCSIELEPFKNALECVYGSSAKDDDNLSGAYIYHENGTDMIACSNTEVGACVAKKNLVSFPEGVLPKFLIDFILKLKDIRMLEIKTDNKGYFSGRAGKYAFLYRAPKFDYPWDSMYGIIRGSEAYNESFKFNNSDLMDALNRISVITDETTHAVKLTVKESTIMLDVEGPGHSGEEVIDLIEPIMNEFSIILDSVYLQNILKDCSGVVEWSFIDEDNPQFVSDGFVTKFFMGLNDS